jgi:hypothetical protein
MRHWLLILLIALLPLRGWAADAMAVEMASQTLLQPLNATNTVAKNSMDTGAKSQFHASSAAASHADCFEHAQSPTQPGTPPSADAHDQPAEGHCSSCVACQVCHSVALAALPGVLALNTLPHGAPRITGAAFTSASAAPGFKPPIS